MSLRDSIEIQEKQAALRETPFQRFAVLAPLIFFALLLFGGFSSMFRSHPERGLAELQVYVACLSATCVALFVYGRTTRKKMTELEIEILKLKRKIEEQNQK